MSVIHVEGFEDDVCSEADKIAYAIAFLKNAPIKNDDDVYGFEIAFFVLNAYLASLPAPKVFQGLSLKSTGNKPGEYYFCDEFGKPLFKVLAI